MERVGIRAGIQIFGAYSSTCVGRVRVHMRRQLRYWRRETMTYNDISPYTIMLEYESIDTNFLVTRHADFLDQLRHGSNRGDAGKEPAIPKVTLAHIAVVYTINEELRIRKCLGDASDLRMCYSL